jgi:hypothetical protein
MTDPMIKITTHHAAECGDPPVVDGKTFNGYVGYFENGYGDQWVFTRDRDSAQATLCGGDVGWNTRFDVVDGRVQDLILGEDERLWLVACWAASSVANA